MCQIISVLLMNGFVSFVLMFLLFSGLVLCVPLSFLKFHSSSLIVFGLDVYFLLFLSL
jgi:hypothetical protein